MAMPMKDFRQLEKLMMMTTSDNDAEVISALRMANKILAKHNYNWTSAFKRLVTVESDTAPDIYVEEENTKDSTEAAHRAKVNLAFEVLEHANLGDFANFISDLKKQYSQRGRLTDNQLRVLFKAADREAAKR